MAERLRILEIIIWLVGALSFGLNLAFPPWHNTTLLWVERVETPSGPVGIPHYDPMPPSHRLAKPWRDFILNAKARELAGHGPFGITPHIFWLHWFYCTLAIIAATLALTIPLRYWQRKLYGLRSGFPVLIGYKPPA